MSTSLLRPIEVKRFQTYDLDAVRSAESLERRRRLMQAKAAHDKADISNALGDAFWDIEEVNQNGGDVPEDVGGVLSGL
jgi:hypothetical protein